ncbi:tripartite motif-containing protein 43-like, partial [Gracilinanus agilis]|uniref:tripartite motif-containing protein 43-like n=1 Tax=Gracilinanus agilis TaxID=191870 RepID=UPI001CFD361A
MSSQVEEAEGLLCGICLDEVIKSVTTKCGHAVCMTCLRKNISAFSCCPICWKFSQLRTLQSGIAVYPKVEGICNIHQEDAKLFCKDTETLLCVTCSPSEDHENHTHWPIEVAAPYYRKEIQTKLDIVCRQFKKAKELLLEEKEQSLAWTVEWIDYKEMNKRKFWRKCQQMCKYLRGKKEEAKEKVLIVEKMNRKINQIYQKLKEIETTQEPQIMEEKKEWEHMMSKLERFLTDLVTELQNVMEKPDEEMLQ